MTPEELIEEGIKSIEKYGHVKGRWGDRATGFCALGSIGDAAMQSGLIATPIPNEFQLLNKARNDAACHARAVKLLHNAARRAGYGNMPSFNDNPETSKEDVVLMMKRAARGE